MDVEKLNDGPMPSWGDDPYTCWTPVPLTTLQKVLPWAIAVGLLSIYFTLCFLLGGGAEGIGAGAVFLTFTLGILAIGHIKD